MSTATPLKFRADISTDAIFEHPKKKLPIANVPAL